MPPEVENVDGMRAVCSASISPLASIAASVCVGADRLDPDVRRQVELQLFTASRLLLAAGVIGDAVDGNAVMLGQDSANPHRRRHLVLGRSDPLADQVLRLADAGARVDVDARMAKEARRKDRDRDERARLAEHRDRVRRQRHLGDVELAMPQHPEEGLLDGQIEIGEVDAVGLHRCRPSARGCGRSSSRRARVRVSTRVVFLLAWSSISARAFPIPQLTLGPRPCDERYR